MPHPKFLVVLAFVISAPPGLAGQAVNSGTPQSTSSTAVTNADVIAMTRAGLSADLIRTKLSSSMVHFETTPAALIGLKEANVDESVIKLMMTPVFSAPANSTDRALQTTSIINIKSLAQLQLIKIRQFCPACSVVIVSNFNSKTGSVTHDWLTKDQRAYLKERQVRLNKAGVTPHFAYTKYAENADYVIMWSQSVGSRPYTTYRPVTTVSNTSLSGTANTAGGNGYSTTSISGQASTNSTSYVPQTQDWQFVDVIATVYGHDGKKLFESSHRGNFRWSKPDKDCLEDAYKYIDSLDR